MSEDKMSPVNIVSEIQTLRMSMIRGDIDLKEKDFLGLLTATAKTAMDELRIATDKDNANADRELAAAIMENIISTNSNPLEGSGGAVPTIDLPEVDLVPGELDTEASELEYKTFIKSD